MELYRGLRKDKMGATPHEVSPPNVTGGDDKNPVKVNSSPASDRFHFGDSRPRNVRDLETFVRSRMSNVDDESMFSLVAKIIDKLIKRNYKSLELKGIDVKKMGTTQLQEQVVRTLVRKMINEAAIGSDLMKLLKKFGISGDDDLTYISNILKGPSEEKKAMMLISLRRLSIFEKLEDLCAKAENTASLLKDTYQDSYNKRLSFGSEGERYSREIKASRDKLLPLYKQFIEKYEDFENLPLWNNLSEAFVDLELGIDRDEEGEIKDVDSEEVELFLTQFNQLLDEISEDVVGVKTFIKPLMISEFLNVDDIIRKIYEKSRNVVDEYSAAVGLESPELGDLEPLATEPEPESEDVGEEDAEGELESLELQAQLGDITKQQIARMKELQRQKISREKLTQKEEELKAKELESDLRSELGLGSSSDVSNATKRVKASWFYRQVIAGHDYDWAKRASVRFPGAMSAVDAATTIKDIVYAMKNMKVLQPVPKFEVVPEISKLRSLFLSADEDSINDLVDYINDEIESKPNEQISKELSAWMTSSWDGKNETLVKRAIESYPILFQVYNDEILPKRSFVGENKTSLLDALYNATSKDYAFDVAKAVGMKVADGESEAGLKKKLAEEIKAHPEKFRLGKMFFNDEQFKTFKDEIVPAVIADDPGYSEKISSDSILANLVATLNHNLRRRVGMGMRGFILDKMTPKSEEGK